MFDKGLQLIFHQRRSPNDRKERIKIMEEQLLQNQFLAPSHFHDMQKSSIGKLIFRARRVRNMEC